MHDMLKTLKEAGFDTVEKLHSASVEDMAAVYGIQAIEAEAIKKMITTYVAMGKWLKEAGFEM